MIKETFRFYERGGFPTTPGAFMLNKGSVYKVLSYKYVPDVDDEYEYIPGGHELTVENVTETAEGQAFLDAENAKLEAKRRINSLKKAVQEQGTPIVLENGKSVSQPEGTILFDTFNIYGSGERLIETETELWYIINNGGDGDYWGRNTVSTGGAGAYGWRLKKEAQTND